MHKTVCLWKQRFSAAWDINFAVLEQVHSRTAGCAGLVHAVRGPRLDDCYDTYAVSMASVGLQRWDAKPHNEQEAARAAHGLLHGLLAIHKVGCACVRTEQVHLRCK